MAPSPSTWGPRDGGWYVAFEGGVPRSAGGVWPLGGWAVDPPSRAFGPEDSADQVGLDLLSRTSPAPPCPPHGSGKTIHPLCHTAEEGSGWRGIPSGGALLAHLRNVRPLCCRPAHSGANSE